MVVLSPCTFPTGTCPKLDAPVNGRKLGKSQSIGHEVHFLCDPGYELVGSESRVCQESLTWSGQQTTCRGERPPATWSHCSGHFPHCLHLIFFPQACFLFFTLTINCFCYLTHWVCHRLLCKRPLPCSLFPFLFLCIIHVTIIFPCRDTFHMWPMIIFPLYVLWSLSRELIECCNMWYSNPYVSDSFKITAQRLFDPGRASPTLWLHLISTHLLYFVLITALTYIYHDVTFFYL